MMTWLGDLALSGTRLAIDRIDDRMVVLFSHRQRLAAWAGKIKARTGRRRLDTTREAQVITRARDTAQRCGLDPDSSERLMSLLIAHAHQRQCDAAFQPYPSQAPFMSTAEFSYVTDSLLGALPPPRYWRPLAKHIPVSWQHIAVPRLLTRALTSSDALHSLQPIAGRHIGIKVNDLGLSWVLSLDGERLVWSDSEAEAMVTGSATDLLLLASRMEDADTLFFQRRLMLTGDTELGLLLRNLLDRMPWESFPLGSRILLQRGARLLQRARSAHRSRKVAA
ncbi:SCP2 sterol-binding domain-containing protein [Pseudoxanthomonas mexicana]|uniref:chorismate mutase n=1 Tax=Pseudoxanthomonas mexicana TaxID=128785 RepID=A0ABX6RDG4_PSEMX|nr:chorismate mutase [Pseudoxanthomonas mexicana]MCA0299892.1 SCP2 sterol-binding domain-containing protein [Pseudomonadota bacterium]QLQ29237.1 MAG: SCP2 sterol-binding domain-containing protein [Pseudoxanthomonas sp.]QND80954.1 SCP2 sterol-binding domain-containing protein [Pseudoxanthomonas mexicana]